ncbi:predicted protein [Postia placenta Mad-698-R]|uniref:HMG box domain-containing protein n=2 Tax=Postia placenta MAD-698-R-SB12 TaxID=670580 RepID=A0A1X6NE76_9APHY|nr:hypothetical protein POSPLADRAFT_1132111 [Postia placenta MAD-698-R-SB12]EED79195.1 predicted protein [Postia placenta Mad-698-R]OSX66746.1 hypothetical protein POSPLADRAFT_1132111 [Postia placenta MAD-698-R-SB12]
MAGASRRSPDRAASRANPMNPPRPPNAWILYRSDKLKQMMQSQLQHGHPKKPQSSVSKEVAAMWKAEDPGVRGEYERLADVKKAEHAEQYPGYKFQPMKKEEKARRREEKRLEKERAREEAKRAKAQMSAYAPQYVPMVHMPYYHDPELPGFPSPPMSAASTPCSTPGSSLSELAPEHARPPSSAPTPAPAAQVSYAMPPPPEPVASGSTAGPAVQPPAAQFLQVPGQNSWSIPQATDASSSQPGPSNWTLDGQPQAEIDPLDWLTLDIPSFDDDAAPFAGDANMHTADANANAGGDALALLAEGASIWRMDAFDAGAFLADPPGDFDVQFGQLTAFDAGMAGMGDVRLGMEMGMGMGQDAHAPGGDVQRQAEQFSELLSHFDFSQLPGGRSLFPSSAASGGGGAGSAARVGYQETVQTSRDRGNRGHYRGAHCGSVRGD